MITTIAQQELSRIFGEENHGMIGLVSDHANSNKLFAVVAGHYKVEKRVRFPPITCWSKVAAVPARPLSCI
jgi:hypothetical protein